VPGALEAARYEGRTFAYPLTMSVSALRYHPQLFEEAGIPLPRPDWTISEFADALNQLAQHTDTDYVIPFAPRTSEDTDWLLMMAAYGGTPIDYRSDPPTWNFTDPANVDAIRQVLDLARAGLIDYQKLGTFQFSGMQKQGALMAVGLGGYDSFGADPEAALVNYPRSSDYRILSLGGVGGGYIKIDTEHPEACYRWISTVADHPELFDNTMPARLSAIDDPATAAAQGESAVALYQTYADMALDPQTLRIPPQFGGSFGTYFIHQFLTRAFDAYVLQDADLEQALADAQAKADQFTACYAALPEPGIDATSEEYQAYSDQIEQCIMLVDPDMAAERAEAMGGTP
jgi:ABC-type glycerol-3-phosphate transport system substrate-binding protein